MSENLTVWKPTFYWVCEIHTSSDFRHLLYWSCSHEVEIITFLLGFENQVSWKGVLTKLTVGEGTYLLTINYVRRKTMWTTCLRRREVTKRQIPPKIVFTHFLLASTVIRLLGSSQENLKVVERSRASYLIGILGVLKVKG